MPADRRLTIETARVGQKVVCLNAADRPGLRVEGVYVVAELDPEGEDYIRLDGRDDFLAMERFIHADPEPTPSWATEELREALVEAHRLAELYPLAWFAASELIGEIKRAPGLLPRAPASTTLPAMYLGAEAFEESGS